ncbi:MAG: c-type cytochrome, partial [Acidobacteriota bacterium]
ACATCHGADGRGASRALVAFDDPLPDFTDCSFASREPDEDWLAVVHSGGPARAFGRMMPAFGEALSEAQMRDILVYVRTWCADNAWPRGELNLPRALVTEKAYPEDETVVSSVISAEAGGLVLNTLIYERRFGPRNQIEVVIPFGLVGSEHPASNGWGMGPGDLTLGLKRAVAHSLTRGSILSVAGEVGLPVGDESLGLSKRTPVFEPFVAFGQILPAAGFLHAQAGVELPVHESRAEREAFWRVALGRTFSQNRWGRAWSPMVELLASRELDAGQATRWDLLPQMQVTLSTRQHVMINAGVRVPLTSRTGRSAQVMFYLLWDWFDGPFFEGW